MTLLRRLFGCTACDGSAAIVTAVSSQYEEHIRDLISERDYLRAQVTRLQDRITELAQPGVIARIDRVERAKDKPEPEPKALSDLALPVF